MEMNPVLAWGEILQIKLDANTFTSRRQRRRADRFPLRILQFNHVATVLRRNVRKQTSDDNARSHPRDKMLLHFYPPYINELTLGAFRFERLCFWCGRALRATPAQHQQGN